MCDNTSSTAQTVLIDECFCRRLLGKSSLWNRAQQQLDSSRHFRAPHPSQPRHFCSAQLPARPHHHRLLRASHHASPSACCAPARGARRARPKPCPPRRGRQLRARRGQRRLRPRACERARASAQSRSPQAAAQQARRSLVRPAWQLLPVWFEARPPRGMSLETEKAREQARPL